MKTKIFIIALFSLSLFITSCSNDDDNNNNSTTTPNIVELALATPDLSSLVAALNRADGNLTTVLSGSGPFTVLAPTNDAFANFLTANGFASLDAVPTDVLAQVLLNHVIMADVSSSDLISMGSGYTSGSASGPDNLNISIYFDATNGVTFNNTAMVTTADVNASNGTVHIIDTVLELPSIVDHAVANPSFSNLVAALGAADGDLVNVLSTDGPFTVLAPDNNAFSTFLNGTALGDVDTAVLSQLLLNHVIIGSTVTSSALVDAGTGYTNTGATGPGDNALSLYYNTSNGVVFNGVSTVTQADVVGTNGIIHAVDTVIDIPTVVTFATADPTFSTLVEALTTLTPATDFASILSRTEIGNTDMINPDFTVFAPTNDAFASLAAIPAEGPLTQVLLHHVIQEANITSSMLNNPGDTTAGTLEGDNITITLPGTGNNIANITDGSGATDIGIIAVDVQAGNGVIHVINKVMINN
ncbi:fasciclin domain-containing protein [Oceanihabitans sp. 2_MG-2023]|uniref:fasciclin domain-containing protein n=1 Tax=Oceanihabitans sp. 2_MG-2023 TaxID=3062661 RepID=UPI0026E47F40|nr:fasciclin domain-containing protein [Oceanihabitans sp. 2_MG-2023]MDO6596307.1 fasciclin domain-containing protein [Oceanihabitans sp. 2_MG-2023]